MRPLTARQLEVLAFIANYRWHNNRSPSYRDIADHFGWQPMGAYGHVRLIVKKGYLARDDYEPRSIRLTLPTEEPSCST